MADLIIIFSSGVLSTTVKTSQALAWRSPEVPVKSEGQGLTAKVAVASTAVRELASDLRQQLRFDRALVSRQ